MKENLLNLRNEVIALREKIETLEKEESSLTKKLQKECNHETIYETDYRAETLIFKVRPPRRICIFCGEIEEGWDCGYSKLTKEPLKMVSSEVFGELWKLPPLASRLTIL